ncbi:hypothetical protein [Micromonospora sp. RP3T]|uniref:hypothetical protein n=1 Tax=Micromonospora sp. RP3T TaxID=2135446 RepID=UPI003D730AA6
MTPPVEVGHPLDTRGVPPRHAGVGAGWLGATIWAMLGAVLAVALRAVALPVGAALLRRRDIG